MTGDWLDKARLLAARGALFLTIAGLDALAVAVATAPLALAVFFSGAAIFFSRARRLVARGAVILTVAAVAAGLWFLGAAPDAFAIFSSGGGRPDHVGAELIRERALVIFDGAAQTLVVEPAARVAPGRSFVWAVALPAPPEYIKSISPAALNTLEFTLRPKVIPHEARGVVFPILAALVGWALAAGALWIRRDIRRAALIPAGVGVAFGSAALLALSLDPGEKARVFPAAQSRGPTLDDYDILQMNSAQELKDWLGQNGFGSPTGAPLQALNDYGQRGWVFVVARLKGRAPATEFTLAPLEMRFPTETPVMPVRLNAVAAPNGLQTLIFAHMPRAAVVPGFKVEFSDKLTKQPVEITEPSSNSTAPSVERALVLQPIRSETYGALIKSQGDLNRLLPAAGWISRLSATLSPADMTEDISFYESRTPVTRVKAFTTRAALARSMAVFLMIFALALPVAALFARRERVDAGVGFGFASAAAVALAAVYFNSTPKAALARVLCSPREEVRRERQRIERELSRFAALDPPRGQTMADAVARALEENYRNPYTGEPMRREQSPGNFGVDTTLMGGAILSLYDDTLGVSRLTGPLRVGRYTARAVVHPRATPTPEPTVEEKKNDKPKTKSGSKKKRSRS